jgi:hypothetical protein
MKKQYPPYYCSALLRHVQHLYWLLMPAVVLCMYGKATGNGGGSECHSAERAFFNIVIKNKHGFLPDHTADARQSFLSECDLADPAAISQIISKYGRIRG